MLYGIIFEESENNDFSLWTGFRLSDQDRETIETILEKYAHEGFSVRGTLFEIGEELNIP